MAAERSTLSVALWISLCTLASRITGLARDMLLAHTFGVSWVHDAWNYAFQVPNLFRRLFGEGALAAVFVPVFTQTLETDGRPAAWRLLAGAVALLTTTLVAIVIILELVILLIWLLTPELDPAKLAARELLLSLTALMLPFMVGICIVALFAGVLNALDSFVPAALMPIVLNICMIAGIVWFGPALGGAAPQQQIFIVGLSVLAAGGLQLLIMAAVLRGRGVTLGWRWSPRDPLVSAALGRMGPVLLGQGVLALGVFLDAQLCTLLTHKAGTDPVANWGLLRFTYPLEEGALTALTVAARLYQFPLGVLAVSLGTAALPTLTRMAARSDFPAWAAELRTALRMALFVGVLTGGVMLLQPASLVRVLFEYGSFTAADTDRVAAVLRAYGLAMWAYFAQHLVFRAYYSLGDVRTPLKINALLLPGNLLLSLVLLWQPGVREAGFALSSAITSGLGVVLGLAWLARRQPTPLVSLPLVGALLRMVLAMLGAGTLLQLAQPLWHAALEARELPTLVSRGVDVALILSVASGAYLGLAAAMRLGEPRELLRLVRRAPRSAE